MSLDLPADMRAAVQDAARAADIAAARAFGLGGELWNYATPSGAGVAERVYVSQGTVRGLAFRQQPGPVQVAVLGGTPVLDDVWRFFPLSGAVSPGGVIVSQADNRYQFTIASTEPWYGDTRCNLERLRGPVTISGA